MSDKDVIIKVDHMTKSYGDNVVLEDINTVVNKGDIIAIIGPSGCGKSTFIRTLNLLEKPDSGSVLLDGQDLTDKKVDINKMRQKVGMVFQHFNLFPNLTIKENITLAPVKTKLMSKQEAEKKADDPESIKGRPENCPVCHRSRRSCPAGCRGGNRGY